MAQAAVTECWPENQLFSRSGSKAKDGKERERDGAKRLNDGNNNGKLRIANATSGGACKAAWVKRANDGNNNGQATHGARKHAWRTQAAWANFKVET